MRSSLDAETLGLDDELLRDVVQAVRCLLETGLNADLQRGSVRVGAFQKFGGGLKAELVGGLRIDVNAVLKVGDGSLLRDVDLIGAVNALESVFPQPLRVVELPRARHMMLMEQLTGYETLLSLTYQSGSPISLLQRVVEKAIRQVRLVHRVEWDAAAGPGLFRQRLRARLVEPVAKHDQLHAMATTPGRLRVRANETWVTRECPPLNKLVDVAVKRASARLRRCSSLQHGDPHLANILWRPYGKGVRVRLIDPNGSVGKTSPFYDYGKLVHFADPMGWVRVAPEACSCRFDVRKSGAWVLSSEYQPSSARAESRRQTVRAQIDQLFGDLIGCNGGLPAAAVGIAAAHSGLVPLIEQEEPAKFGFAVAQTVGSLLDAVDAEADR